MLQLAYADVQKMLDNGMLVQAPAHMLCPTEERLNWEGLWRHFWAPEGMSSILRAFLAAADAHLLGGWVNGLRGVARWKRGAKKQPVQDAGLTRLAKTPVPGEDAGQEAGQRQQSQAATGASHPATGGRRLTI